MTSQTGKLQLLRRDFLFGAAAGVTATLGVNVLAADTFKESPTEAYAQFGEDISVWTMLETMKIEKPTYLDIGAYLPIFANNTYYLYKRGGHGVLVEPNVDMIAQLKSKRPRDVTLNIGVGITDAEAADYYVMTLSQWNTFSKEDAELRVSQNEGKVKIERVVKMPLVNINKIIAEHFAGKGPDYLSIDVEGLDLEILKTLDFYKYEPKIICTETLVPGTMLMTTATADFLKTKGYHLRGMTFANSIFVHANYLK
jgi:FkbM family methyltransferase